jgi:hypothetical protein
MVGTSASVSKRTDRQRGERAGPHVLPADHRGHEHGVEVPGDEVVDRRRAAAERNVQHAHAGLGGEQFAGEMARAADPDRSVRNLAWLLPRQSDELIDRADGQPRGCAERHGSAADEADRREILYAVVGNVLEHARIHGVIVVDHHQRVAVGLGACDRGGRQRSASARPTLDDELLAEHHRQLVADEARHGVEQPAHREGHDDLYRPGGICLLRRRRAEPDTEQDWSGE